MFILIFGITLVLVSIMIFAKKDQNLYMYSVFLMIQGGLAFVAYYILKEYSVSTFSWIVVLTTVIGLFALSLRRIISKYGVSRTLYSSIIILTVIGFAFLIFKSSSLPEIAIDESGISLGGIYGEDIAWSEVKSVDIIHNEPSIIVRVNGVGSPDIHLGKFTTDEYGEITMFVLREHSEFLIVESESEVFVISFIHLDNKSQIREIVRNFES